VSAASRPLTATQLGLPVLPCVAEPDDSFGMHLLATLDTQLRVLLEHQRSAGDPDEPEAVHQMRIATRRLRVALRAAEAELPQRQHDELEGLRAELAWLNGLLGPVRDLDVLAIRLADEGASLTDDDQPGFAEINDAIRQEGIPARQELLAGLAGRRYRALLRAMARLIRELAAEPEAVREPDPTQSSATPEGDSEAILRRPVRKLRREVAGLDQPPAADALHQVRIRAKRVRYAAEQAADRATRRKRLKQLAKAAKQLQDVLGEHHDTVAAEQRLREIAKSLSADGALVAGRLVEREWNQRADREARWPEAWHDLQRQTNEVR
jgi:CHAD domain-containing protein